MANNKTEKKSIKKPKNNAKQPLKEGFGVRQNIFLVEK